MFPISMAKIRIFFIVVSFQTTFVLFQIWFGEKNSVILQRNSEFELINLIV